MKSTNIIIIGCICALMGGSVATAYFNTQTTTQPKRANENLNTFTLTLSEKSPSAYSSTTTNGYYYTNMKQEYGGYNEALMANLELINQNKTEKITDLETGNIVNYRPTLTNSPTNDNNILIKYKINPYKSLYESKTTQTLITQLHIEATAQNENIINWKITSYTSTNNWDEYMGQTNWNVIGNNKNIIDTITNPQNEQNYNENIQILQTKLDTNEYPHLNIETKLDIRENLPTYHFILIEPYIETSGYNEIQTVNGFLGYFSYTIPPKITGYVIPNIDNYEVIDIPSIMWNILTMPFAFISTAFNLTIFPGTPYQINISNIFLTILAILIFVWIVKIIFKR